MTLRFLLLLLLVPLLLPELAFSQEPTLDDTHSPAGEEYQEEGFNLFLFCLMIAALLAILFLTFLAAFLAAATLLAATGITLLGVSATSVFTAMKKKSAGAGFIAFLLQIGAVLGLGGGIAAGMILGAFATREQSTALIVMSGGATGLLVGILLAWVTTRIWRNLALSIRDLPTKN